MKSRSVYLVVAAVVVGAFGYVSAASQAPPEPEDGFIVGEVIDIGGYAMKGRRGEEHGEAGRYRADLGFPIGILEDETDRVYVALYRLPVPAAGLQTGNTVLSPYMGKTVVAQGLIYRTKGIDVIRISLVTEY